MVAGAPRSLLHVGRVPDTSPLRVEVLTFPPFAANLQNDLRR